jgi:hypothetical protein
MGHPASVAGVAKTMMGLRPLDSILIPRVLTQTLKPVPFKDGTLLFLELLSTEFAVISVHQRGMELRSMGFVANSGKAIVGLRPSFRPRYAGANLGHPSRG